MGNTAPSSPSLHQERQKPPPSAPISSSTASSALKPQSNECPIDHSKFANKAPNDYSNKSNDLPPSACPSSLNASSSSGVNDKNAADAWWKAWPFTIYDNGDVNSPSSSSSIAPQLPPSLEEAARHAQIRQYQEQRRSLSTERVISSIPRAATITTTRVESPAVETDATSLASSIEDHKKTHKEDDSVADDNPSDIVPPHQFNTDNPKNHWVYPSEQQFYNALRRKGWKHVPEDLIPNIVQIHNAVNEQGWRQVCYWERIFLGHSTISETRQALRLVQLVGRPTTKSLHVYMSQILYPERQWFDRHDWYVERNIPGTPPRRYMLDFYEIQPPASSSSPDRPPPIPVMYLHVRPAMDTPQAVLDRFFMLVRNSFPGTALLMDQFQQYKQKQLQLKQQQQKTINHQSQQSPQLGQYAAVSSLSSSKANDSMQDTKTPKS